MNYELGIMDNKKFKSQKSKWL